MDPSLTRLDTAIRARIAKENDFITRITAEFRRISAGLQRTANSSSPQVQSNLAPFIQRINAATAQLKSRPFGDGSDSDLDALVRSVTNTPSSGSSPGFFSGLSSLNPFANAGPGTAPANQRLITGTYGNPDDDDDDQYEDPLTSEPPPQPRSTDPRFGLHGGRRGGWKTKRSRRSKRRSH